MLNNYETSFKKKNMLKKTFLKYILIFLHICSTKNYLKFAMSLNINFLKINLSGNNINFDIYYIIFSELIYTILQYQTMTKMTYGKSN